MPYKRGKTYYVDLRPPGYGERVGPLSTRSTSKATAQQMEATVRELATTGRLEYLDALKEGKYTLPELHAARVANSLPDLLERGHDPPLKEAVESFLALKDDTRYDTALKKLLDTAPTDAKLSWAADSTNLRLHLQNLRSTGLAPATERREFMAISGMLAMHLGEARRTEIMKQVPLRRVKNGRTRWLTAEEIERLREPSGDMWRVFALAIATGLRQGELLRLRVRDVDLGAGSVAVSGGKTPKSRRLVPVGGRPLEQIRKWIREEDLDSDDAIFPGLTKHKIRTAWERARAEARLDEVRFHDLRHTYAVHCAMVGMPLGELQNRLGHETLEMTMRYAIYQPSPESAHYNAAVGSMGLDKPG